MTLRRVQVTDFRCLDQADLELDSRFTLISGPNASGKTSLLEAIYMLGRGRSFRTRQLEHLIRLGADHMVVFGELDAGGRRVGMGVEGTSSGVRARIAGERVGSLAELAAAVPVQIIDPEVHRLIEEGPSRRRRFLDWGVFHVEPGFVIHWQKYQQILRQRNAGLRARQAEAVIGAWTTELIRYGELITQARERYVALLAPVAGDLAQTLLGMELRLSYRTGWARDLSFRDALDRSWRADQESGVTQVGPQRAEITIRLNGVAAKDRISRGQQKLLAAALLMAQIKLYPEESLVRPTLLLDDPAAELDRDRLGMLMSEVQAQSLQLVVTTLQQEAAFGVFGTPGHHYRLERGTVRLD
jgi:DNA replication and repair protein RecF